MLWGVPVVLIFISVIIMANSPLGLFRFNRITASFNPESDPNGAGWIGTNQNLIINSAQLIGESENMSNALNIFDEGTNYALISLLAHYGWITSGLMILIVVLLSIKLIINSIFGGVVIYIVNLIGSNFGFHIGLNIVNSIIIGLLGLPGVVCLIIIKLLVG